MIGSALGHDEILALGGGSPRRITQFTEDQIRAFAWSRDGKRIALSRGIGTGDVVLIADFR